MTFLDTGFLFALISKRDAHHARVVEVFRTFKDLRLTEHLLTTNHVIAETITLARKIGHDEAVKVGDQLYSEKLAGIHWASPDEERAAFDHFKQHQDQTYSFVDCLSFVVMEKLGIREALAVDSDFTLCRAARPFARVSLDLRHSTLNVPRTDHAANLSEAGISDHAEGGSNAVA